MFFLWYLSFAFPTASAVFMSASLLHHNAQPVAVSHGLQGQRGNGEVVLTLGVCPACRGSLNSSSSKCRDGRTKTCQHKQTTERWAWFIFTSALVKVVNSGHYVCRTCVSVSGTEEEQLTLVDRCMRVFK